LDDRKITMDFTDQEFCIMNLLIQQARKEVKIPSRYILAFGSLLEGLADISTQVQAHPVRRLFA